MRGMTNLIVIALVGVILADLINHVDGTKALINGVSSMWSTSVNGMLGNPTTGTTSTTTKPTVTV